jgi:hydrogenase maturation protease
MSDQAATLVIGIGNRLREDDGAGYRMAETLAKTPSPGLQVLAVQQLSVDVSVSIAASQRVLFIDATLDPERCNRWSAPCLEPISAQRAVNLGVSHHLSPPALLAITEALYQRVPQAWQLLIPGLHWNHGEAYSPLTAAAVAMSLPLVKAWSAGDA